MKSNLWKEYLYIPKKERWVVVGLILLLNTYFCIQYLHKRDFSGQIIVENYGSEKTETPKNKAVSESGQQSFFVNQASKSEWVALGFSEKQAQMILNYKKMVGQFNGKKELLKVYCVDTSFVNREDIRLIFNSDREKKKQEPSDAQYKSEKAYSDPKEVQGKILPEIVEVKINQATAPELKQLKGIGDKLSSRIIKYRDLLGGFINKEQLLEVYGLSKENYERFRKNIILDGRLKRININSAGFKQLIRHPYLGKKEVNAILNYRKVHGKFKSVAELKKLYSISDSIFVKIKPYLKISDEP